MISPTEIARIKDLDLIDGAKLLMLWMIADGQGVYTQSTIMELYGIEKQRLQRYLYNMVNNGVAKRIYTDRHENYYRIIKPKQYQSPAK